MMKSKQTSSRRSPVIAGPRWLSYAAAGAATALAGATSAKASIHYSGPIHQNFESYDHATFPLDAHGGAISFAHQRYTNSSHFAGGSGLINIFARAGASIRASFLLCPYTTVASALPLQKGQLVSAGPFVPDAGLMGGWVQNRRCGFFDLRGQFERGVSFVGFKFNNGAGDQYGWARVRSQGPPVNKFILLDYAYGDVGEPVRAGEKSEGATPVQESLGGLALGAAGIVAWRRSRAMEGRK